MKVRPLSWFSPIAPLRFALIGLCFCVGGSIVQPALGESSQTVLHVFDGTEGYVPTAGLQMNAAGELFGSNLGGGVGGSVFKLAPPSPGQTQWTWSVIQSWSGGGPGTVGSAALALTANGDLFGSGGGGQFNRGSVFRLAAPFAGTGEWNQTILYSFKGRDAGDGDTLSGGVLASPEGGWYGTAAYGGANNSGMVYKLSPPDMEGGEWTETILYSFNPRRDGSHPQSPLAADSDGNLYGTTTEEALGGGAVFRLSPPRAGSGGWTEKTQFRFAGGLDGGRASGKLLIGADGTLYGTAEFGGLYQRGVIFKLVPGANRASPWTQTVLHHFAGGVDGAKPRSGLVADGSGGFYGAASGGGLGGRGTVFHFLPTGPDGNDGELTTLHYS